MDQTQPVIAPPLGLPACASSRLPPSDTTAIRNLLTIAFDDPAGLDAFAAVPKVADRTAEGRTVPATVATLASGQWEDAQSELRTLAFLDGGYRDAVNLRLESCYLSAVEYMKAVRGGQECREDF